ncbi:NADase-type glycan-binding domain-containing protein [Streptantibioticus cattleyicolor]|uniref:Zinc-ribbon domain-containing protein n=1 Tax=Streptantibioticus cattleyicolor (strain ATCC 35852 / DSM 46488 / JCM 4925 / NBRC 14057 / NRRL 8057) TaxID=1003195 RepID=F8JLM8_STREN|nr:zinc-ribbon domain-containing protein [Streptantibioticus cattleyicolor]AEW99545.1 hypothetical protein SCATT_p13520 [Streptantibioticus cattleyicolor NRRL 8057 = DSM 46488]CCB71418.1 conserved protein of unknown function [Streptantibioticus cattleyicolor NRRL 8057 = DSM 46488]
MRSCPDCGTAVADGEDFCPNCGAYLGWSRTAGTGPATSPAPAPPPADRPPEPPTTPADAAGDPVAVRPAKPVAQRPKVRRVVADTPRDGAPCPHCGTPNPPGRRFCARCAEPLTASGPAAADLPWWRRWFTRRRRRFGGSGNAVRRLVMLLVAACVVAGAVVAYLALRGTVQDTEDKLRGAKQITPAGVSADAAVPGHPASAAADGLTNRYWGAPALGDSVTFTFRDPFRLVDLVIHTGASTDPQEFHRQARPIALDMWTTTKDGRRHQQHLTLDDRPGQQTVPTGISDVTRIQLVIRSAAGTAPGRHIALGEVEFFARR